MASDVVQVRLPRRDLVADLVAEAMPEFDLPERRPMPRHIRLYVAGWMLGDGTPDGDAQALRRALQLYGGTDSELLNKPRKLTTEDVVHEVLSLLGERAEVVEQQRPANDANVDDAWEKLTPQQRAAWIERDPEAAVAAYSAHQALQPMTLRAREGSNR